MNLWPTRKQWKGWSLPSKLTAVGTLVGILSFSLYGIEKTFQLREMIWPPGTVKKIKVPLFHGKRHLGDNVYARIGGVTLPTWDDPQGQNFDGLLFFDKKEKTILSSWGIPNAAQILGQHYRLIFEKFPLQYFEHVKALSQEDMPDPTYPGCFVKIDPVTCLVWEENGGNFYYRYAPFAWVVTLNLFKELLAYNVSDPATIQINSARIVMSGFHGGKRRHQDENIEFIINSKVYKQGFTSLSVRNEEVVVLDISSDDLRINPTSSNYFAVAVLPFQEESPLPPPQSKYPRVGPAHFRDIEIGDAYLELEIMHNTYQAPGRQE